jgi:hypothetical protein
MMMRSPGQGHTHDLGFVTGTTLITGLHTSGGFVYEVWNGGQEHSSRRCYRGLTGEVIRQDEDGEWICPKSEEVLKMAGVPTIEEYVHSEEATDDHEIRTNEEYI